MYTYTLDGTTVNPSGEWTIEPEKNVGQIFYRRVLHGDLVFRGDDYTFITGQSVCTDMEFKIFCDDVEYWVGSIKYPYGFEDVDEDACVIKGTPEVVDEYTCIMQNYETEYDFSGLLGSIVVFAYVCGGAVINTMGAANLLIDVGVNNLVGYLVNSLMGCPLTIASSFMLRSNFPNGTNYAGAYGTDNYITGATNRLEFIYFKANRFLQVVQCEEDANIITFKQIEDLLKNAFNAYWYIDQNGDFRVEHIHFFDADFVESDFEDGIDLTAMEGRCLPTYASRRNKYTYLTDLLFDQERWTWQHYIGTEGTVAHGLDFTGEPIYYGAAEGDKYECVPGNFKEKEYALPLFWTDVPWYTGIFGAGETDALICPGFILMDVDLGVPNKVHCEQGAFTGVVIINGHLSTANLQDHYFTYDRIFLTGHMNNGATPPAAEVVNFDSEIRKQLQDEIEFPWCCEDEFNPLDFIVTEMGSGAIYSAIQSRLKNSITVKLLY